MLLTTAVSPFTCLSSMQNFIVNSELESYLRLNRAACGEWTLALQDLLGCTGLVCDLSFCRDGATLGLARSPRIAGDIPPCEDAKLAGC